MVQEKHIDFIDGIKGIASIVVVIFHFFSGFFPVFVYGGGQGQIKNN